MSESSSAEKKLTTAEKECITKIVQSPMVPAILIHAINKKLLKDQGIQAKVCHVLHFNKLDLIRVQDKFKYCLPDALIDHPLFDSMQTRMVAHARATLEGRTTDVNYVICHALLREIRAIPIHKDFILNSLKIHERLNTCIVDGAEMEFTAEDISYLASYLIECEAMMFRIQNIQKQRYECRCKISYCQIGLYVRTEEGHHANGHATALIFAGENVAEFIDPNGWTTSYPLHMFRQVLSPMFGEIFNMANDLLVREANNKIEGMPFSNDDHGMQRNADYNDKNIGADFGICGLFTIFYIFQLIRTGEESRATHHALLDFHRTYAVEDLLNFARKILIACKTTSANLFVDACGKNIIKMTRVFDEYYRHTKLKSDGVDSIIHNNLQDYISSIQFDPHMVD